MKTGATGSRYVIWMTCSVLSFAGLTIGCGQDASEPTAARRQFSSPSADYARSTQDRATADSARAKFHKKNRLDQVGVAHNAAMAQYARRLRDGQIHGDVCDDVVSFVMRGDFFPADKRISGEPLRSIAMRGMSMGACADRFGEYAKGSPFHLTAFALGSVAMTEELSPAADDLLVQMQNAVYSTASSGDLATALLPVLDAADALASNEADIIYATASVAQSSEEYWEVTLTPSYIDNQVYSMNASYGTCFDGYDSAESAVSACMGLHASNLVLPTANSTRQSSMPWRLVQQTTSCNYINMTETVHQDFLGAGMGAWVPGSEPGQRPVLTA